MTTFIRWKLQRWWWWWWGRWWHSDDTIVVLLLFSKQQIHSGDEDGSALLNTPSSVPPLCSNQSLPSLLFIEPMSLTVEEKVASLLPLPSPCNTKKQESISSIGPCPMADCLASFWCSSHAHTHTCQPMWYLFSSLLLSLHCPCHMASEKAPVCVSRLWGQRGGYRRLTRWQRLPTLSGISMNTWGQARLNGRAEAVEKSSPEGKGVGCSRKRSWWWGH